MSTQFVNPFGFTANPAFVPSPWSNPYAFGPSFFQNGSPAFGCSPFANVVNPTSGWQIPSPFTPSAWSGFNPFNTYPFAFNPTSPFNPTGTFASPFGWTTPTWNAWNPGFAPTSFGPAFNAFSGVNPFAFGTPAYNPTVASTQSNPQNTANQTTNNPNNNPTPGYFGFIPTYTSPFGVGGFWTNTVVGNPFVAQTNGGCSSPAPVAIQRNAA